LDRLVTLSRVLNAGAAGLALLAAAVYAISWRTPESSSPQAAPAPIATQLAGALPATARSAPADSAAERNIVAANIFSPDRAPPKKRYVPPSFGELASVDRGPAGPPAPPALRLFGITITPNGAQALIEADPKIAGAEVYRVGDRIREFQLIELSDSTAVLDGPDGELILRLRPRKRQAR
jgi:hypothetical protein